MLTYSRVSTQHIEELMLEPEIVIELIQDMGFSVNEGFSSDEILSFLESRWQGNEQNYSLEAFSDIAKHVLLDACPTAALHLLLRDGKKSSIMFDHEPIYVLSPHEVHAIALALSNIDMISLQQQWMDLEKFKTIQPSAETKEVDLFWMLFPGIVTFFTTASNRGECVLRSIQPHAR